MKDKVIIGLVGHIASGKGKVAEHFNQNHQADIIKYSDIIKDILQRLNLENNRKSLQKLSTALRTSFGEELLAKTLANDIKKSKSKIIIIDGVRRKADISIFDNHKNFKLIGVETELKTRYQRITNRTEKDDDQNKKFNQFKKEQNKEPEKEIDKMIESAHYKLNNDNTLEDLAKQIKELIKEELNNIL